MIERMKLTPERKRKPANRKHFTEDNVLALKPKRMKQFLIWDEGTGAARGLAVLVSPTGTKSFRCVFYYPGSPKPHWMHLGRVGEMALETARNLTRKARGDARQGIDPGAHDATRSDSFKASVEDYIKHEQIGRNRNKSATETQAVVLNNCAEWHSRPVATIRYQEIEKRLQLIRDGDDDKKPREYLANRLYSHLKDFFGWCVRSKKISASPMTDMEKPFNKAKPRDREWFKKVAGANAIKSLWNAADQIGGNEGHYIKLMILTGKRKTALVNMKWEEIEPDWFWDPPEPNSKNKRLHGVPLSNFAQRILGPRQTGTVFGGIDLNRLQAKVRSLSDIKDFFWHGVRHLCETKTAELKVGDDGPPLILPHIRDLLFDHVPQRGSGQGYDHHDYKSEMRAAMEHWSDHVEKLVTKEGTVRLRG